MKANTAFVPNKKLVLHFDVEDVLVLPAEDKDFYVFMIPNRSWKNALTGLGENLKEIISKILIKSLVGNWLFPILQQKPQKQSLSATRHILMSMFAPTLKSIQNLFWV
jgi:hypothetical protein